MSEELLAEVEAYLTEFRRVNGDRAAPSDFAFRYGWLTFRHYGVTHRHRRGWLKDATERLRGFSASA